MRNVVVALAALTALSVTACTPKETSAVPSAKPEATAPAAAKPAAKVLAKGDVAPPFKMMGSDGKEHTLAEHLGNEAVVVAWFPKAFTGG
jgi:hypothetical protein